MPAAERWSIQSAQSDSTKLEELLDDGWEPFGVVGEHFNIYVYLRKVLVIRYGD